MEKVELWLNGYYYQTVAMTQESSNLSVSLLSPPVYTIGQSSNNPNGNLIIEFRFMGNYTENGLAIFEIHDRTLRIRSDGIYRIDKPIYSGKEIKEMCFPIESRFDILDL